MQDSNTLDRALWGLLITLLGLLALVAVIGVILLARTPVAAALGAILNALFAANTVQALWYVTRAAGLMAYVLLWFSTAWGLAVSSKILDVFMHRAFTYDFHQFLSLLAIGFTFVHVAVLVGDRYLPFSVAQILIPFVAPYRPLWVGIGVIAFYLMLLVSITFYIRRWIGVKTFRMIHLASFLGYAGAAVHGFYSGTDSPLWTTQLLYAGTTLVIVFLTVYWLATVMLGRAGALSKSQADGA